MGLSKLKLRPDARLDFVTATDVVDSVDSIRLVRASLSRSETT